MADDKTYVGQKIYLTDLIDRSDPRPPRLEGFTFIRCQIHGPVVVYLATDDDSFTGCTFLNAPEEMLFEVPENANKTGILGLISCTFKDCEVSTVGFAGPRPLLDILRRDLA